MKMKLEQDHERKEGLSQDGVHTNNELFNQMLNRCKHPRRIYGTLMALVEPSVQQADDMTEKRKVLIGNLLSGLDVAEGYEQVI